MSEAKQASGHAFSAAAEIGGFLYAVGGFTDITGALGMLEVYNPLLGNWRTLASMPTPRGRLAVGDYGGALDGVFRCRPAGRPLALAQRLADAGGDDGGAARAGARLS